MPLQNRVTPDGGIIAHPARGLFMGNRGVLHDEHQSVGPARWRHKCWVTCLLEFKGRRRRLMQPNRYTELFFLDEAVALAAGHRPCGECRRADYNRWRALWARTHGGDLPGAKEMDEALHASRAQRGARALRTYRAGLDDLPDGTFIRLDGDATAWLVLGGRLLAYGAAGYCRAVPRPSSSAADVLTPRVTVAILKTGYEPALHPSTGIP